MILLQIPSVMIIIKLPTDYTYPSNMEHHKKHQQHRNLPPSKQQFFREVFQQCKSNFSQSQFEFFIKCMIPHRTNHHQPNTRLNNLHEQQVFDPAKWTANNINDINLGVFQPSKTFVCQQRSVKNLPRQKKNKRILTTPTEKVRNQLKFSTYQDLMLYKKMKSHEEGLFTDKQDLIRNRQSQLGAFKMHSPQPLFYSGWKNQAPKLVLKTGGNFRNKQKTGLRFRNLFKVKTEQNCQNRNSQRVPDNFVQILKSTKKFFGISKTGTIRNYRF